MTFLTGIGPAEGVTVSRLTTRGDFNFAVCRRRLNLIRLCVFLIGASWFAACTPQTPLYYWKTVTFKEQKKGCNTVTDITLCACQERSLGRVVPVYVWMKNTKPVPWSVELNQIFAMDDVVRIPSIPPGEAVRLAAMKSKHWTSTFATDAGLGAPIGAAIGAGIGGMVGGLKHGTSGASVGVIVGGAGGGAIGAALGGLWGLIEASNLYPAGAKDNSDFNQQLNLLALSESKEVKLYQDFTVSGYVYFPNRYFPKEDEDTGAPQYGTVEVMLVREANGAKEKVTTQKVDASWIACPEPK